MIILVATRLTDGGAFNYAVQKQGHEPLTTFKLPVAVEELSRLGVPDPELLIAEAQQSGTVAINERGHPP